MDVKGGREVVPGGWPGSGIAAEGGFHREP